MAKIIVDENIVIEAAILAERAKVLADDLTQGYFSMSDGRGGSLKSRKNGAWQRNMKRAAFIVKLSEIFLIIRRRSLKNYLKMHLCIMILMNQNNRNNIEGTRNHFNGCLS